MVPEITKEIINFLLKNNNFLVNLTFEDYSEHVRQWTELLHLYEVVPLIEIVHQVGIDHQEVLQELEDSVDQNVVFLHYKVDIYRLVTKN